LIKAVGKANKENKESHVQQFKRATGISQRKRSPTIGDYPGK
jgi:hypothetical protein